MEEVVTKEGTNKREMGSQQAPNQPTGVVTPNPGSVV